MFSDVLLRRNDDDVQYYYNNMRTTRVDLRFKNTDLGTDIITIYSLKNFLKV